MSKYILSFLLVIVILVSSFGISSFASEVEEPQPPEKQEVQTVIIYVPYSVQTEPEEKHIEKPKDTTCVCCSDGCHCEVLCHCPFTIFFSVFFGVVLLFLLGFFIYTCIRY